MKNCVRYAVVVLVSVFCVSTCFAASYNFERIEIAGNYMPPRVTGDFALYAGWEYGNENLYMFDLVTREQFLLRQRNGGAYDFLCNDGYMVFVNDCFDMSSGGCLSGYDLAGRESFLIMQKENIWGTSEMRLGDELLAWIIDCNEGTELCLYGYDLADKVPFMIGKVNWFYDMFWSTGPYVLWKYEDIDGAASLNVFDSRTSEVFVADPEFRAYDMWSNFDANDGYAVWAEEVNEGSQHQLVSYDLADRSKFVLEENLSTSLCYPETKGGYMVWSGESLGYGVELKGYDAVNREFFVITEHFNGDYLKLKMSGEYVLFVDFNNRMCGYDLAKREEFLIIDTIGMGMVATESVKFNGKDMAAWVLTGGEGTCPVIKGYDLDNRQEFVADVNEGRIDEWSFGFEGDYLFWNEVAADNYKFCAAKVYKVANGSCGEAMEIAADEVYGGTTVGAAGEDESSCGYGDVGAVWFYYDAKAGGEVTVSTDGSGFDTVLSVFNACGGDEVTCNDDYSAYNLQSRVTLETVKGKRYYIRVAGFDGSSGEYQVRVSRGGCAGIRSDFNGDCVVDMKDFAMFAEEWLATE